MKNPIAIICLTVIGIVTIAATVFLVATGHDPESVLRIITTGVSLFVSFGGIFAVQAKQGEIIKNVAKSVNGNNSTLIQAAIASDSLSPETIAGLNAQNDTLIK